MIERVKPFLEAHGRLLPALNTPDKVCHPQCLCVWVGGGGVCRYVVHNGSLGACV